MKKRHSLRHSIVVAGLIVLGVYGAFAFLLWELRNKNQQIADAATNLDVASEKLGQLTFLEDVVEETKADRELLASYFVNESDIATLIAVVEAQPAVAGVTGTIQSIRPEQVESATHHLLRLDISIEGEWAKIIKYIDLVSRLPYVVTVESVSLEKQATGATTAGAAKKPGPSVAPRWTALVTVKAMIMSQK